MATMATMTTMLSTAPPFSNSGTNMQMDMDDRRFRGGEERSSFEAGPDESTNKNKNKVRKRKQPRHLRKQVPPQRSIFERLGRSTSAKTLSSDHSVATTVSACSANSTAASAVGDAGVNVNANAGARQRRRGTSGEDAGGAGASPGSTALPRKKRSSSLPAAAASAVAKQRSRDRGDSGTEDDPSRGRDGAMAAKCGPSVAKDSPATPPSTPSSSAPTHLDADGAVEADQRTCLDSTVHSANSTTTSSSSNNSINININTSTSTNTAAISRSTRRQQRSQSELIVKSVTFREELNEEYDDARWALYSAFSEATSIRRFRRDNQRTWYSNGDYVLFRCECRQTIRWMERCEHRGECCDDAFHDRDQIECDLLDHSATLHYCSWGLEPIWHEIDRKDKQHEIIQTILDEQSWMRQIQQEDAANDDDDGEKHDWQQLFADIYSECSQHDHWDAQERAMRLRREIESHQ